MRKESGQRPKRKTGLLPAAIVLTIGTAAVLAFVFKGLNPKDKGMESEAHTLISAGGHPDYMQEISSSLSHIPQSSQDAQMPPAKEAADDEWCLLLVNQNNLLPNFFDITLKKVQSAYRMDERAAPYMEQMLSAANDDGISLLICSAYRSVEKQQQLFSAKVWEYMNAGLSEEDAKTKTATMIAVPGTSEHHTGLAADIVTPSYQNLDSGFEDTDAFRWLDANAHKYGFILRFPKGRQDITGVIYEPWHYRYVGTEHAVTIKEQDITLEEYLDAA